MTAKPLRIACAFVLAVSFGILGCDPGADLPWTATGGKPADTDDAPEADRQPPAPEASGRETWDIYTIQDSRVGYGRTSVKEVSRSGQPLLRVEGMMQVTVKRFGEESKQEMRFESMETPEGVLVGFDVTMEQGRVPVRVMGSAFGGQLRLETVTHGKKTTSKIPWKPEYGGFHAPEQTLLDKPMKPGEKRTIHALILGVFQVAAIEMHAKDYEPVKLPTGTRDLLCIDTITRFPDGTALKGTVWTDRTGEMFKEFTQAMNLTTYRVPKEIALEETEPSDLDLGLDIAVKLDRPIVNPHETKQIRYRVELEGGDPATVFASGISQKVESIDPHTAEVTFYAVRPGDDNVNPDAPADPPTRADREPNNFIQSDDAVIVADAKKATGDRTDPWQVAVALEKYVHDEMTEKNFSQAFATAAEVAKSREGDCSEHAVFLAALARARGIPARVAFGLIYLAPEKAFFYHMWTEVYVRGRWVPLDAVLARGGIGAAHLKLGNSDLEGATAMSALLPVIQVIGRLKVERL